MCFSAMAKDSVGGFKANRPDGFLEGCSRSP